MISQLPVLPVLLPLIGAPVCAMLRRPILAWAFTCIVALATWACSVALMVVTWKDGVISYSLGGWAAPWGIEYRIDMLNATVLLVVSTIAAVVLPGARASLWREVPESRRGFFFVAFLLCLAGQAGITATGDAFNLFVFLEISSLATYALVAMGKGRGALVAAYNYLVLGTIGATFILIGIGFLYMMTGTLNMVDLSRELPDVVISSAVFSAYAFIVVGVCIKLALFPLHFWLPGAYSQAPSIVTAFLAATSTKVALYVLIRFVYSVFRFEFSVLALPLQGIFLTLGLVAVFVGSLVAIYAADFKRGLAYSSVAQVGFLIIGVGLGTLAGLQATLIHLFNHALMKAALFMALAAIIFRCGGARADDLRALGRAMPLTAGCLAVGGLSLIGIPGTAGFISKWYLVVAAADGGRWPVAAMVLLGSLLTAVYVWRMLELLFLSPATNEDLRCEIRRPEAPPALLAATLLLAAANVYFGLDSRLPVTAAASAAAAVMEPQLP